MRCACIDIGSNTTRLLVAESHDGRLQEVLATRAFTRLGSKKGDATGFDAQAWAKTLRSALGIEGRIGAIEKIMDKHDPAKRVALYVDEWGTWYDTPQGASALYQQNSLRDAMVAAVSFNAFHRHSARVKMANIAQMVNVLQAMALTDGAKMVLTPNIAVMVCG